jgi:hypothetical protein
MILDISLRDISGRLSSPPSALLPAVSLSILFVAGTASGATGPANGELPAEILRLWPYHASLVILGFLLLLWGMTFARRKGPGWLKRHRALGAAGSTVAIVGAVTAFYMVSAASSVHFRVPHAYIGAFIVLLLILTPSFGLLQFKVAAESRGRFRGFHRLLGRALLLLMALNILFGILIVSSS